MFHIVQSPLGPDLLGFRLPRNIHTCVECKNSKTKCSFMRGELVCGRCKARNLSCIPYQPVQRQAPPSTKTLEKLSREKDVIIEKLLSQYQKQDIQAQMREWTANLDCHAFSRMGECLSSDHARSMAEEHVVAAVSLAYPGNGPIPDIVRYCSLYPEDIDALFRIFFGPGNDLFSPLDPLLHQPAQIMRTCPFLFTGVIAVASRQYTKRPDIYTVGYKFYKHLATRAFIDCPLDINTCLGFLMVTVFPYGKKRWMAENLLEFAEIALRIAIHLELYKPPPKTLSAVEKMNWERTWYMCWLAEEVTILQLGKWSFHRLDKYNIPVSAEWRNHSATSESPRRLNISVTGCVDFMLVMLEWRKLVTDGRADSHDEALSLAVALEYDSRLAQVQAGTQIDVVQLFSFYGRLIVLSAGLQFAFKSGAECQQILAQAIFVAQSTVQIVISMELRLDLAVADTFFAYVTFATSFLLSLLRPELIKMTNEKQQSNIVALISQYVDTFSGPAFADDNVTVRQFALRVTKALLNKYTPQYKPAEPEYIPDPLPAPAPSFSSLHAWNETNPWDFVYEGNNHFQTLSGHVGTKQAELGYMSVDEENRWFSDYLISQMPASTLSGYNV